MAKNRQLVSNLTKILCTSLLLLSFGINSEGAFLSYKAINDGLSAPNEPNYPFYYDNLLYLIVGVNEGHLGSKASLVQYNSGGTVAKNLTFPLPCYDEGCIIEGALFGLVNNSAYISLRRAESRNDLACMIYQIDLISFQISNSSDILNSTYSYYCAYSLPFWTPYNSTYSIFSGRWFEYETLSILDDYVPIYPYNYLGGASTALAENNLIFYQVQDGYNENFVSQNVDTYKSEYLYLNDGYMMVFLGDNSTNVAITTIIYGAGFNITLVDAASNFDKYLGHTPSNELNRGAYQSDLFGDSSNNIFFIGTEPSSDVKGIFLCQYKVDVTNNTNSLYDKLTIVNYFKNPGSYSPFFSVLSWGLNEQSQQFAIVAEDSITSSYSLLVVDYDNSIAP